MSSEEQRVNLTGPDIITLDLKATDKVAAINELAELLYRAGKLSSTEDYVQDVLLRETQVPTSIGHSIAIPHSRSAAALETCVGIGRTKGFIWDESDDEPVFLVFLLAVPLKNPASEFIHLLSSLAQALLDDDFRQALLDATEKEQVAQKFLDYSVATTDLEKEKEALQ